MRMVTHLLGFVGDIKWIDADAVAADQAGAEGQEVPLGAGRRQHVLGVDSETVAYQRDFIDQGDVDVALGVLENFGKLGHAD